MNKVQKFAVNHNITNALIYGVAEEKCVFERQAAETGYKRISTFFSDLSIAEWYGPESVKDTYNNVIKSWFGDYKMFTEFVISLNWKSWEWYERGYEELSQLYSDLYYQARDKFYEKYDGNTTACDYFFEMTD